MVALIISYIALAQGFPGAFLLDDRARIMGIDIEGLDFGSIYRAIIEANSGLLGRPVSLFSLYLTKGIHGEDPAAFRYENILYHLLTGVLLFWFLGRLFLSHLPRPLKPAQHAWLSASVLAAIWLVHPLHVSTALYTVQRMTQLSTIFTICALLCYVIARQDLLRGRSIPVPPILLLPLFMLLGIFSKEDAALVPLYIILIELLIFRFHVSHPLARRTLLFVLGFFAALPIIAGTVYLGMKLPELLNDYLMRDFSLSERLATQLVILWRYVGMLLLPRLSEMSLFHDSIPVLTWRDPTVSMAGLAWILVFASACYLARRIPLYSFGILLFLGAHLMESTFIPLELMFEHRNYLASIGILISVFSVALLIWERLRFRVRVVALPALVFFIIFLASIQAIRADAWNNEAELLLITAEEHPESIRTTSMLANELLESGYVNRAKLIIQKAIDANTDTERNIAGLHLHLLLMHCFDKNKPIQLYEKTKTLVSSKPMNAYVVSGLKALQSQVVKDKCPALTIDQMIELNKTAAKNLITRDRYRFLTKAMAGSILGGHGRMKEAREFLESALQHRHRVPLHLRIDTLIRLAEACVYLDERDCAADALGKATELSKSSPLGMPLTQRNDQIEALKSILDKKLE